MLDLWIKFYLYWYFDIFIQDDRQLKSIQELYTYFISNHRLKCFFVEFDEAPLGVISILHKNLSRFTKNNLVNIFNRRVSFKSQSSCTQITMINTSLAITRKQLSSIDLDVDYLKA